MRVIRSSEAKARLSEILDQVERGETVCLTRYGRPIARIVPEVDRQAETVDRAIQTFKDIRSRAQRVTLQELLDSRHEGHRA